MWQFIIKYLPKNWWQYVLWAVVAVTTLSLGYFFGVDTGPVPAPPVPVFTPPPPEEPLVFGWVEDPDAVKAVAAQLQFKVFSDTPAYRDDDPLPKAVYLWHAYKKQFGRAPPSRDQGSVGSCVSFGTSTAIERTLIVQIVMKGQNFEYRDNVQEAVYGGSRVQIGGGRISGDGSVGAWAAQWVNKYGILDRGEHGKYDLKEYSVNRCKEWGRSGVPADLIDTVKKYPVGGITQVKTVEELKRCLANGYGVAICSNQGFAMQRDANGVCQASGTWAHCMCCDAYHTEGEQLYFHIENSWGPNAHKGPVGWGDPPTSGFWAKADVVGKMLRADDSWAFSMVKGFPSQKIDWTVWNRQPHDERLVRALTLQLTCY